MATEFGVGAEEGALCQTMGGFFRQLLDGLFHNDSALKRERLGDD